MIYCAVKITHYVSTLNYPTISQFQFWVHCFVSITYSFVNISLRDFVRNFTGGTIPRGLRDGLFVLFCSLSNCYLCREWKLVLTVVSLFSWSQSFSSFGGSLLANSMLPSARCFPCFPFCSPITTMLFSPRGGVWSVM